MSIKLSQAILFSFFTLLPTFNIFAQGDPDLHQIASGFTSPVGIASANDGSKRLFIVEQRGVIKIISDIYQGTVESAPFLDIQAKVHNDQNEQGLFSMVFHPGFPDSPYFYVNYIDDGVGVLDSTRISRFTVDSTDANLADPNSERVLMQFLQEDWNHNGGDMHFGNDGYLYISSGDGGGGGDPNDRAQDTTSLLGKILRIDVDSDSFPNDPMKNYGIPSDNPFIHGTDADAIWSYGWRNPWRFSFDRANGDMYVGDVGQSTREEISKEISGSNGGLNYGWDCREGSVFHETCPAGTYVDPIYDYARLNTDSIDERSVTGGFVYRGSAFPNMNGWYIFIDFFSNKLRLLNSIDTSYQQFRIADNSLSITAFGESDQGELYACSRNGPVYRIIDHSQCIDDLIVNTIDTSFYSADSTIMSSAKLMALDTTLFAAGVSITLDTGFMVEQTGVFQTEMTGCMESIFQKEGQ